MTEVEIKSGDYVAQVRTLGAGLNSLTYKGQNLVDPFQQIDPRFFRGDVLAPWPNRIRDGRYEVEGKTYIVAINESERKTALHGLVFGIEWLVSEQSASTVKLEVELPASESYPTSLNLIASYSLSTDGLEISISARNVGSALAPYGVSIHPYLIADPSSTVNEWELTLHSNEVLEVDLERLLPIALKECSDLGFDFRDGSVIGPRFIDHAFKVDPNEPRSIRLLAPNKSGVVMNFDDTSQWIQIHTADRDGGKNARMCLAVEPMTCPPDAFRSGEDLIWLKPGGSTRSSWRIQKIEGEI